MLSVSISIPIAGDGGIERGHAALYPPAVPTAPIRASGITCTTLV